MALRIKPSKIPNTSKVLPLCNLPAARMMATEITPAPKKAAADTDKPASKPPPTPAISKVAIAAPSPAPALTPMICGSARGLRKTACICAPESARAAPASSAVATRGIRKSNKMLRNNGSPGRTGTRPTAKSKAISPISSNRPPAKNLRYVRKEGIRNRS